MKYQIQHYQEILKAYQEKAILTLPNLSKEENIEHCFDGMHTELGEMLDTFKRHRYYGKALDIPNLKEEAGDFMWYNICLYHIQEWTILKNTIDVDNYIQFMTETLLTDQLTFNQRIRREIEALAYISDNGSADSVLIDFIQLCEDMELDFEQILLLNNKKLLDKKNGRYKSGMFSEDAAINRNLEEERKLLEE